MLIAFLIALVLPWFVEPSTYWRDGPEFVLSAAFLDIPHPPGAPFYAMLAHPLTWLQIGPLAARAHLFSVLCLVGIAILVGTFLYRRKLYPEGRLLLLLSLPVLPGVMHQALTAEVYILSALIILAILLCIERFHATQDRRWILSSALLIGLGSGAHIIVGVVGGAIALTTLIQSRGTLLRIIAPTVLSLLCGVCIWGYLPARALQDPPLNSGAPTTLERTIMQITNARDRDLRPKGGLESFHLSTSQLVTDATRLAARTGWGFVAASVLSLIVLPIIVRGVGLPIVVSTLCIVFLFAGWDFAPTVLLIPLLLTALGLAAARLPRIAQAIVLVLAVAGIDFSHNVGLATALRDYEKRAQSCVQILRDADIGRAQHPHGIALVEQSWFCTNYLQRIEGLYPQVIARYQPAAEFPAYFNPERREGAETSYASLNELLSELPANTQVSFEAGVLTADRLKGIARCDAVLDSDATQPGRWYLQRPLPLSVGAQCGTNLLNAVSLAYALSAELQRDEQLYREAIVLPSVQLLSNIGSKTAAIELLNTFCTQNPCTDRSAAAIEAWRASNSH